MEKGFCLSEDEYGRAGGGKQEMKFCVFCFVLFFFE